MASYMKAIKKAEGGIGPATHSYIDCESLKAF